MSLILWKSKKWLPSYGVNKVCTHGRTDRRTNTISIAPAARCDGHLIVIHDNTYTEYYELHIFSQVPIHQFRGFKLGTGLTYRCPSSHVNNQWQLTTCAVSQQSLANMAVWCSKRLDRSWKMYRRTDGGNDNTLRPFGSRGNKTETHYFTNATTVRHNNINAMQTNVRIQIFITLSKLSSPNKKYVIPADPLLTFIARASAGTILAQFTGIFWGQHIKGQVES